MSDNPTTKLKSNGQSTCQSPMTVLELHRAMHGFPLSGPIFQKPSTEEIKRRTRQLNDVADRLKG